MSIDPAAAGEVRRVSTAVIGCGYWGKNLVRNFHQLGALTAISDVDPEVASRMAGQFGVECRSTSGVIESDDVEAVVIAAPAVQHFPLVRDALLTGKHVFVEKPLALELPQAAELVELAHARDRRLMVGHLLQYHPVFLALRALVDEGRLGRLQYIYSNRLNLGKVRREENILWSFAPHDLSMILALVGQSPETVLATGANYLHQRIADVTTTHLSFAGGEHAHVFVSWLHPFKEQKLVVVGDRAMAVFDDGQGWDQKLLFYPHTINWRAGVPEPNRADAQPVQVEQAEPLRLECAHFLECVRNAQRPRTDGAEGLRVLRVLDAAERSIATSSPVSLEAAPTQAPTAKPTATVKPDTDYFVHPSAVVDTPVEIGTGTKIWHFSHILPGTRIGRDCSFGQNVMVGPDVVIGNGCKVQNNVSIYKGVTFEDNVFAGPSMVFTNVYNPRAGVVRMDELRPTLVKRGATIGANATIVCGVTLGEYCMIAAGAVVTRDVPANALMAGVPARRIGWVSDQGEILGPDLVCPRSGQRYRENGSDMLMEIGSE